MSKPEIRKELEEIELVKILSVRKKAKDLFYDINLKNKDIRISTFDSFFIELLLFSFRQRYRKKI